MPRLLIAEDYPSVTAEELVRLDAVLLRRSFAIRSRIAQHPFSVLIHIDASHYPRLLIQALDSAASEVEVLDSKVPTSFICPNCKNAQLTLYLRKMWACIVCSGVIKMKSAIKRGLNDAEKFI